jgi:hypothetical protein
MNRDPAVTGQIVALFRREPGDNSSCTENRKGFIPDLPVKASFSPVFPTFHPVIVHRPEKTGEYTPVLKKGPDSRL